MPYVIYINEGKIVTMLNITEDNIDATSVSSLMPLPVAFSTGSSYNEHIWCHSYNPEILKECLVTGF